MGPAERKGPSAAFAQAVRDRGDGIAAAAPKPAAGGWKPPERASAAANRAPVRGIAGPTPEPYRGSGRAIPPGAPNAGLAPAPDWRQPDGMSTHGYESGRLNLPFVGIATFGKRAYVEDWTRIEADAAILGAPFDAGTQWRAGARFGPRAVRDASTLFSFGHAGAYDHEDDATYLGADVRLVDIGDAYIVHTDTAQRHANIRAGVRAILNAGALPVVIGGDHSVNIPCIEAFDGTGDFHVLQIDAHLDFVDERHGVRTGHGNPMRRAAEKPYVTGLSQVGIRNVSSTAREGYADARAMGSSILSVRQVRHGGLAAVMASIPTGARVYVTLDIDAFCPSIAPGTGTPSHGGFLYYEVLELLQAVARSHEVVGIDLVEVAPDYDPTGSTAILAAQILLNFLGFIFHARD